MSKKCNENTKICCEAKNCMYHSRDCECTAQSVKISNPSACTGSATCCETFKMKDSHCDCI